MAVAFQTTDVPLGKGDDIDAPPVVGNVPKGLELPSHTAYRWISKEEMRDLGVTSAITKVLKLLDSSEKKKRKKKKVVKKDKGKGEEKEKETTVKEERDSKRLKVSEKVYKMVAFDMDGTLLNPKHYLSEPSKAKLRELSALGVKIAIATGRSGPAVYDHVEDLGLTSMDVPAVVYNGGMILNFKAGDKASSAKIVQTCPVPASTVEKVVAFAKRRSLLVQYYTHGTITVNPLDDKHRNFIGRYAELTGATHTIVDDGYKGVTSREGALKLLVMTDDPDGVKEDLEKELPPGTTCIRGSPPFFVEILAPNVSKGATLVKLCENVGVAMEDTVAFGDGDNDFEFIRDVGYGIAMKNGRDMVKSIAKRVTDFTNEEDGVEKCLTALQQEGLLPKWDVEKR